MSPTPFLPAALLALALAGAARAAESLDDPPLKAVYDCVSNHSLQQAYDCITQTKAAADAKLATAEQAWPDTEPMRRAHAAFMDFRDAECRSEAMEALPKASSDFEHLAFYTACQSQFSKSRADRLDRLLGLAKAHQ